jgi:ubiquinone/menaquinone biosynthesis C-methylase UbiE
VNDEDKQFSSWEEAVSWLLEQPDQQELVKACYYDRPAGIAAQRFWQSEEWQELKKYFPPSKGCALDVGAGMGVASYALARDGWQTTALEPDGSSLVGAEAIRHLAKKENLDISVEQNWAEKLPFNNSLFDLVHARQVLHHAKDLEKFCEELYRVLKPDGVLVATREHVISNADQLPEFLARHPLQQIYGGENAFMLKQYKKALIDAGFSIKSTLGPFDSVINYAPFTIDTLCNEMNNRASNLPGGQIVVRTLLLRPWRNMMLRLLSLLDSRPGRLFTFICVKEIN